MNAPIARLFVVVVVLFAVLVGFTSRWTVFDANALRDNPKNHRELIEEQQIRRGLIRAGDDSVLARSLKPARQELRAHLSAGPAVLPRRGLQLRAPGPRRPRALLRRRPQRAHATSSARSSTACRAPSRRATTWSPRWTRPRSASRCSSSAGARAPSSRWTRAAGAIKVMASVPGYDPNTVKDQRAVQRAQPRPGRPAAEPHHAGGLSAGLDLQGRHGDRRHRLGPLHARLAHQRAQRQDASRAFPSTTTQGESFGDITLTEALTKSVNTVFGEIGEKLGKATMKKYMDRLGFGAPVEVDLPRDERAASGERVHGRVIPATNGAVDVGPHGHRPGQAHGHAAADGDGRLGGGQRRQAHEAPPRRPDRRPRRAHGQAHRPRGDVAGHVAPTPPRRSAR